MHAQERQLTRFFCILHMIYKENRTEPAVFLKTELNFKNPFHTSLLHRTKVQKTTGPSSFICKSAHECTLGTNVADNAAQKNSDNLPSYLPDNQHCSDVYWSGGHSSDQVKTAFVNS